MGKQLADGRHEMAADDHQHRTGQRRAQDAGHAMLGANADGGADEGEAGAHHARQADAHWPCALALNNRHHARADQGGIHQGNDFRGRQLQCPADHQRYRNNPAQGGEQMLKCQQHGSDARRTVFHLEQQRRHSRLLFMRVDGSTFFICSGPAGICRRVGGQRVCRKTVDPASAARPACYPESK
ncbi:hypothetical protein D3C72_1602770 [compost metagenome]